MARIRTIKPTIWIDDDFVGLSRDTRLLMFGMLSHADDDGRIVASPASLIGAIYPYDEVTPKQVKAWRDELAASGVIALYEVGRGTFAVFPNWHKHQVIAKYTPSKLPEPVGIECSHRTIRGQEVGQ